jgi:hypothetical protein
VLTEEELDEIGADLNIHLEYPWMSSSRDWVSEFSARREKQLFNLRPYKTTAIYACLAMQLAGFIFTVCQQRWDWSASDGDRFLTPPVICQF